MSRARSTETTQGDHRVGRPTKHILFLRDYVFPIRLTEDERKAVGRVAAKNKTVPGKWARAVILEAIRSEDAAPTTGVVPPQGEDT